MLKWTIAPEKWAPLDFPNENSESGMDILDYILIIPEMWFIDLPFQLSQYWYFDDCADPCKIDGFSECKFWNFRIRNVKIIKSARIMS